MVQFVGDYSSIFGSSGGGAAATPTQTVQTTTETITATATAVTRNIASGFVAGSIQVISGSASVNGDTLDITTTHVYESRNNTLHDAVTLIVNPNSSVLLSITR